MYEEGIREIWEKQKATLSDPQILDEDDIAGDEDEDDRFNVQSHATPAQFDDGTSQISGLTSSSRHPKRAIRISREITMADGSKQTRIEVVHDPVVISQYMKRRTEADLEMREYVRCLDQGAGKSRLKSCQSKWMALSQQNIAPPSIPRPGSRRDMIGLELRVPAYTYLATASTALFLRVMPTMTVLQTLGMWVPRPARTILTISRIKKELERLEKNKARRQAREQQKELQNRASNGDAGSPAPGAPGDKIPGGTTRKCANCGQVGHIKTNKKYGFSPVVCTPS
jgi:transcription initiation factor TFIID subunit 1